MQQCWDLKFKLKLQCILSCSCTDYNHKSCWRWWYFTVRQVWNVSCITAAPFVTSQKRQKLRQETKIRTFNITLQSQKTIFKALQRTFDLGLSSIFNFRINWCTKECFSLTLLNCRALYLHFDGNNLYSLFITWPTSETMLLARLTWKLLPNDLCWKEHRGHKGWDRDFQLCQHFPEVCCVRLNNL